MKNIFLFIVFFLSHLAMANVTNSVPSEVATEPGVISFDTSMDPDSVPFKIRPVDKSEKEQNTQVAAWSRWVCCGPGRSFCGFGETKDEAADEYMANCEGYRGNWKSACWLNRSCGRTQ